MEMKFHKEDLKAQIRERMEARRIAEEDERRKQEEAKKTEK